MLSLSHHILQYQPPTFYCSIVTFISFPCPARPSLQDPPLSTSMRSCFRIHVCKSYMPVCAQISSLNNVFWFHFMLKMTQFIFMDFVIPLKICTIFSSLFIWQTIELVLQRILEFKFLFDVLISFPLAVYLAVDCWIIWLFIF